MFIKNAKPGIHLGISGFEIHLSKHGTMNKANLRINLLKKITKSK